MAPLIDEEFLRAAPASRLAARRPRSAVALSSQPRRGGAPFATAAQRKINFTEDAGRTTWWT